MAAKPTKEETLPEDEKKKIERKALEGEKMEKPIDEKVEEKAEEVIEDEMESIKGKEDIEKDFETVEKTEDEEEEKEAEKEETKAEKVESEKAKVEKADVIKPGAGAGAPAVPVAGRPEEGEIEPIFWKAKTDLGNKVVSGVVTDIDEVLESGQKILEPQIVDRLVPGLKSEYHAFLNLELGLQFGWLTNPW